MLEDGDFVEQLDNCTNNTFQGPYARVRIYKVTANHLGYVTQIIDDISVYQFICNVETTDIIIHLVPIVN